MTSGQPSLRATVHAANVEAHDHFSARHTFNVPYISRRATRSYYWRMLQGAVRETIGPIAGCNVLEPGCGTGTFLQEVVGAAGAAHYTGIDLSGKMLEVARSNVRAFSNVEFQRVALEDYAPSHQEEFDLVYSFSFLHHLIDVQEGLDLIRSMLKPGGAYLALHEPVQGLPASRLMVIDNALAYLRGYDGYIYTPFYQRLLGFLPRIIKSTRLATLPIFRAPERAPSERAVDYSEYQLASDDFALSRLGLRDVEIRRYCYLNYVELMRFGEPQNHEMLIMKKSPTVGLSV